MNDWNLQSRAHACEGCHRTFADQQAYHTVLFDERHGFRREDLCAECWQRQSGAAAGHAGFVSHWQGVYEAPPPVSEPIQRETAETLLRKLVELNDPQYVPAGFILAVMLERKRVLKVKEQLLREGRRTIIYEQPKTGEVLTITDPALHLDQLEEVQRAVAHLLEHGLNPPPAPGAAVAAGAEVTEGSPEEIQSTSGMGADHHPATEPVEATACTPASK